MVLVVVVVVVVVLVVVRVVQWWRSEHSRSPPTSVAGVRILASAPYVG